MQVMFRGWVEWGGGVSCRRCSPALALEVCCLQYFPPNLYRTLVQVGWESTCALLRVVLIFPEEILEEILSPARGLSKLVDFLWLTAL